ncbi:protein kinase, AMP-activated, alpha 2 catalytic subunit, partial [Rhizopus stolonifer]
ENNHIQSFFASSPPPWNTSLDDQYKASRRQQQEEEEEESQMDMTSSISVLSSSLPKTDYIQGKERSSSNASSRGGALPIAPINGTPPPGAMAPSTRHASARHLSISQPQKKPKSKSRWHFGIRSKCPAWEVMLEIYRSLQNVGMEWCTLDPYHLRCRYQYPNIDLMVKFDLQLYKLENNSYLVDFKSVGTINPDAFQTLQDQMAHKLDIEQKDLSPYLTRWKVHDESIDHVQSVYPFLDVCSKLITDIQELVPTYHRLLQKL